jgi:hypothetical protein
MHGGARERVAREEDIEVAIQNMVKKFFSISIFLSIFH